SFVTGTRGNMTFSLSCGATGNASPITVFAFDRLRFIFSALAMVRRVVFACWLILCAGGEVLAQQNTPPLPPGEGMPPVSSSATPAPLEPIGPPLKPSATPAPPAPI